MEYEDISKTERQKEALNKWRLNKYRGLLNLTMRFGKTRCIELAIKHLQNQNIINTVLCIAPNHITTLNLHNALSDIEGVTILSISQFNTMLSKLDQEETDKYIDNIDLLVIDEAHKILNNNISSKILKHLCTVKNKVLLLTGSVLTSDNIKILNKCDLQIVDRVSDKEAIDNKWISNYIEYNIAIELDDNDKLKYAKYSKYICETLSMFRLTVGYVNDHLKSNVFNNTYDLVMSCFIGKYISSRNMFIKPDIIRTIVAECMGWKDDMDLSIKSHKDKHEQWNPIAIYDRVKQFKNIIRHRNDILVNNKAKLNAVIQLLELNSVPTIVFNESIEMADLQSDYFNTEGFAYHSNIESRFVLNPIEDEFGKHDFIRDKKGNPKKFGKIGLKKLAIEGIKKGYYKYIFTARSLNEGITIENISQIITTGGDMNAQTYSQRIARGKSINPEDFNKRCIVINLYIDDFKLDDKLIVSRDKQKLLARQIDSNNVIWIDNLQTFITNTIAN